MQNIAPVLKDFVTYFETIKAKSPTTVDEYYVDLRMFFRHMMLIKGKVSNNIDFGQISIDFLDYDFVKTITLSDIYSFLHYLARDRGDSNATRARKLCAIRAYFKFLTNKINILKDNPAANIDSPAVKSTLPVFLTLEQALNLLNVVEGPNKERDFAILVLFLNCGMRLSELVGINITDIEGDTLRVVGKGNKERMLYLNEACLDAIAGYRAKRLADKLKNSDRNALFISRNCKRISVKTVQWLVKKYLSNAGLNVEKYSTHKLRHTAATLMYQNGVDVRVLKEILGHSQLNTTQIYTHVSDDQMRKASLSNPLSRTTLKKIQKSKEKA